MGQSYKFLIHISLVFEWGISSRSLGWGSVQICGKYWKRRGSVFYSLNPYLCLYGLNTPLQNIIHTLHLEGIYKYADLQLYIEAVVQEQWPAVIAAKCSQHLALVNLQIPTGHCYTINCGKSAQVKFLNSFHPLPLLIQLIKKLAGQWNKQVSFHVGARYRSISLVQLQDTGVSGSAGRSMSIKLREQEAGRAGFPFKGIWTELSTATPVIGSGDYSTMDRSKSYSNHREQGALECKNHIGHCSIHRW